MKLKLLIILLFGQAAMSTAYLATLTCCKTTANTPPPSVLSLTSSNLNEVVYITWHLAMRGDVADGSSVTLNVAQFKKSILLIYSPGILSAPAKQFLGSYYYHTIWRHNMLDNYK